MAIRRPVVTIAVAAGGPAEQLTAEDKLWPAVLEDKRAVRELAVGEIVETTLAGLGHEPLGVELRVDRVSSLLARVKRCPQFAEPLVVVSSALGAGPVARR